jgi:hypothetical protein
MDTELILLEQMTKDDIELSIFIPFLSVMIYLFIVYAVFPVYNDNYVTNTIIGVISIVVYQTYKCYFNKLVKEIYY